MDVLVAGGSGFVGRSLCPVLHDRGHRVSVGSRTPDVSRLPRGVETAVVDVSRPDLAGVVEGHDAVVNLVALPSHRQSRGQTHESAHLDGTRHLLAASEAAGVERFVQMSGLGVDSGVSTAYFRAKRGAESLVRASALDWVIYRPSVVFGDGCSFVPFIRRVMPPVIAPLPGGGSMRIQPIWVEDLAPMLADGVDDDRHAGRTYEIGGPEKLTLAEVVELVSRPRAIVPIPMPLAAALFAAVELVPGVPLGRDQYRVLRLDNTVSENDIAAFGVSADDLLTLEAYLAGEE